MSRYSDTFMRKSFPICLPFANTVEEIIVKTPACMGELNQFSKDVKSANLQTVSESDYGLIPIALRVEP